MDFPYFRNNFILDDLDIQTFSIWYISRFVVRKRFYIMYLFSVLITNMKLKLYFGNPFLKCINKKIYIYMHIFVAICILDICIQWTVSLDFKIVSCIMYT